MREESSLSFFGRLGAMVAGGSGGWKAGGWKGGMTGCVEVGCGTERGVGCGTEQGVCSSRVDEVLGRGCPHSTQISESEDEECEDETRVVAIQSA